MKKGGVFIITNECISVKESILNSLEEIENHLSGKIELPSIEESMSLWDSWADEIE